MKLVLRLAILRILPWTIGHCSRASAKQNKTRHWKVAILKQGNFNFSCQAEHFHFPTYDRFIRKLSRRTEISEIGKFCQHFLVFVNGCYIYRLYRQHDRGSEFILQSAPSKDIHEHNSQTADIKRKKNRFVIDLCDLATKKSVLGKEAQPLWHLQTSYEGVMLSHLSITPNGKTIQKKKFQP